MVDLDVNQIGIQFDDLLVQCTCHSHSFQQNSNEYTRNVYEIRYLFQVNLALQKW